ncbi:hypothetical protein BGZ49_010514 [Haplosporangium sp. Z 27]|nr:hypothetical protein BGZ49_010514 [Haplosporangium sp. Z 27]
MDVPWWSNGVYHSGQRHYTPKGFRPALLKDVLEAALATRDAVLQTITAIDEVISIPVFEDPSSHPPSPPGKFRILDHKAKVKVDQTKNGKKKKSR